MRPFKDVEHLVRLAGLIVAGVLAFIALRALAVPAGFGQYGHYRGPALNELRARPISFAGHETCEMCHTDEHDKLAAGAHKGVHCEACHGPQGKHAEDLSTTPALPKTPELCVVCHAAAAAKPKKFPQVVVADHAGDADCKICHQPHNPKEGL